MSPRAFDQHWQRFLPPLNALKAFESAARLKSLTNAAAELNVTRAAVSQQVKQLELYLNATLFERSGSKLVLTEEAEYYLPLLTQVFDSLSVGTEQLFARKRRRLLTLHIAQSFCHQWLIPRLAEFRQQNPQIELKISTTSNPYPNSNQRADIEIINGTLPIEQTEAICLIDEHWIAVAAPDYLQQHPINDLADLAQAAKLATSGYRENWKYWLASLGYDQSVSKPIMQFDHSLLAIEAATFGLGVLLVKDILVQQLLDRGELVLVGEWRIACETRHYLLSHNANHHDGNLFIEWLNFNLNQ
ncbi:LysR substrate-binding domain-containing protein [Vibrio misgurnus]|uniref:LysR substrate-binding domain-containing protein n=1 Tax=Vibrio misgurnus TaxID=2993714 RepID=UPI0023F6B1A6|nr:LysR substrate-binding domain-containing protein [Vibrio sp. VCS]